MNCERIYDPVICGFGPSVLGFLCAASTQEVINEGLCIVAPDFSKASGGLGEAGDIPSTMRADKLAELFRNESVISGDQAIGDVLRDVVEDLGGENGERMILLPELAEILNGIGENLIKYLNTNAGLKTCSDYVSRIDLRADGLKRIHTRSGRNSFVAENIVLAIGSEQIPDMDLMKISPSPESAMESWVMNNYPNLSGISGEVKLGGVNELITNVLECVEFKDGDKKIFYREITSIVMSYNRFCVSKHFARTLGSYFTLYKKFPDQMAIVGSSHSVGSVIWELENAYVKFGWNRPVNVNVHHIGDRFPMYSELNKLESDKFRRDRFAGLRLETEKCFKHAVNHKGKIKVTLHSYDGDVSRLDLSDDELVVQCYGWKARNVPIFSSEGIFVGPAYDGGMYKTDLRSQLLDLRGNPIEGIYGTGFGPGGKRPPGFSEDSTVVPTGLPYYGGAYAETIWREILSK